MERSFIPALPRSLALCGLEPGVAGDTTRARVGWASSRGFEAVQLDASAPDARPRELTRSARRDLAALLRRSELRCSGVDLWIPARDFADAAKADRVAGAVIEATRFAAELAELTDGAAVVSATLPPAGGDGEAIVSAALESAASLGVRVADHSWPARSAASADGPLGVGIDPAAVVAEAGRSADVPGAVSRLGALVASARWSDLGPAGRVPVGEGDLDGLSYCVALATAGYRGWLVDDLRGLSSARQLAHAAPRREREPA